MESRIDILDELKELSPVLAGMEKVNVFTVPDGYFERLGEDILIGVQEETNIVLGSVTSQSSLQVPQGYFESLADTILNRIKTQDNSATELKELSPMLYSIQNENVFTVPQGYFKSLPEKILAAVKPQQTKVVSIHRRTTVFLKYAVAAVFTGVMALGIYKFIGGQPKTSLPEYVAAGMKINNIDEELAKVSDDDIIKYLQANDNDVDGALVANTIDENDLPTQEDYFTDDKALDKYFDNIDLNSFKN